MKTDMTKRDLAASISAKTGVPMMHVEPIIEAFLDSITEFFERGGKRLWFKGWGNFSLKNRRSYETQNPSTGERMVVPATKRVTFKAGSELNTRINGGK